MAAEPMREVVGTAVLADAYDGAIRLLVDAQRFGFALRDLALAATPEGEASATFSLSVPASADPQLIAARLGRHPCVTRVEVRAAGRPLAAAA